MSDPHRGRPRPGPPGVARHRRTTRVVDGASTTHDEARRLSDLLRGSARTHDGAVVLPSEEVLVDRFRAPRNTVREALHLLREAGVLDRRRGVGTVMAARTPGHDPSRLEGPVYFAANGADRVVYANLVIGEVTASPALAERLAVAEGTALSLLERVTLLDGDVLAMRSAFTTIPVDALRDAGPALDGDFWDLLEVAGREPLADSESVITVVRADASSAPHLGLDTGDLVVLVEARTFVAGDRPISLSFLRVPPANFNLTVRSSRS